ncbi:helix-turn-helix domain-containing protein [Candidatus Pantoea soli]|uniref:Transcriptional regulator n=1 Tax=Candidatus Pantoea soli TaxID=3098669 RepID=A0A518XGD0_9GAMM|nr:helix-turn-helix transcriptional regulator [Pantoea soli]QDY43136.1 transcriptional regulator [Pantoea soli]
MDNAKKDWHPADIIAALRKKGTTMAAVSRQSGLCSTTLANALARPWPKGEMLIAAAIGIPPEEIWPSRYFAENGERINRQVRIRNQITKSPH